ncbi:MAG TPA: 4'-phosphopantetheinyl transferase superfamily protein [Mucilaginibacter sp.]|nr:4'-phosphopantetheinyl transferase superfamily protein [Mucilaginibacter sp.]
MISTGNDIVALQAINITRTHQPNFYSKILSEPEKKIYADLEYDDFPFENFVWLLWSIKEAAYKHLQRIIPDLLFTPVRFEVKQLIIPAFSSPPAFGIGQTEGEACTGGHQVKGIVSFGAYTLYSCSFISKELINTIADTEPLFDKVFWGVKYISHTDAENQSAEVRTFIMQRLNKVFNSSCLEIIKNHQGCPILLDNKLTSEVPVSLSHHGNFIGYSFKLPA